MRSLLARLLIAVALASLTAGCSQPAAAPTSPPPAPTRVSEPTKAAAAEPTKAAPASTPTTSYPTKGKAITFIVTWSPGASADSSARVVAAAMEKELGVPVEVVNKAGASSQTGLAELAKSKPDGYTMGQMAGLANIIIYLDPKRGATFSRKDFQMVANYGVVPNAIAVKADSPYKTLDDFIKAAKAAPGKITVGDSGLLSVPHLGVVLLAKEAGVEFGQVHFDGGGPSMTALAGGHVEAASSSPAGFLPQVKAGNIRVLGVMDKARDKAMPDVKTMEEQGYKVSISMNYGITVPAGTPREVVDVLRGAVRKAVADDSVKKRLEEIGQVVLYEDQPQYEAHWAEMEAQAALLMPLAQ